MSSNNNGKTKKRSFLTEVWRNYRKNFNGMLGLFMLVAILLVAVVGNIVYDYDTDVAGQNPIERLQGPSDEHPFGTDNLGRDIMARVIYGARYSLTVAFASVILTSTVGIFLGCLAGYYGGIIDTVIMRLADSIMSIPSVLFGIVIVSALGQNAVVLVLAVAITGVAPSIRVTRASVMTVRGQEFVESARAIGASDWIIISRHVLPNGLAPILVQCTMRMASAIIAISTLSFLGLGVPAPAPEWGAMLSTGRAFIRGYSYMTMFPGIAIMLSVLALNLIGDGLRDSLDPKLKR